MCTRSFPTLYLSILTEIALRFVPLIPLKLNEFPTSKLGDSPPRPDWPGDPGGPLTGQNRQAARTRVLRVSPRPGEPSASGCTGRTTSGRTKRWGTGARVSFAQNNHHGWLDLRQALHLRFRPTLGRLRFRILPPAGRTWFRIPRMPSNRWLSES